MEACFLRNTIIIFINRLVTLYKKNKITEHLLVIEITPDVKVLIQNIRFKTKNTESTERRKTSFRKE